MIGWLLLAGQLLGAPCQVEAPAEAALSEAAPEAAGVQVIVELWLDGATEQWAESVLEVMDARSLPATLVASPETISGQGARILGRAAASGHSIALHIQTAPVPEDGVGTATIGQTELQRVVRRARKDLGVRPRILVAPLPARVAEAVSGRAGFRVLLPTRPGIGPRLAARYENQPTRGVVIPPGPYAGTCPHPLGPWTPLTADRATLALRSAAREEVPLRVAVDGRSGRTSDAAVLARWLDEILLVSGAEVTTPKSIRADFLAGPKPAPGDEPPPGRGGRLVGLGQVAEAAASLAEVHTVPRELPGGLSATEAFLALALVVAERTEGEVVRLDALDGPAHSATSTLVGPVEVPTDAVVGSARVLLDSLPERVPSAMPVGPHLLTASEILLLYASAVRGSWYFASGMKMSTQPSMARRVSNLTGNSTPAIGSASV